MRLKEIRDLVSAIIREKVFKADVPYMVEQRNYINSSQKKLFINLLNKDYPNLKISFLEVGSRGGLPPYSNWYPLLMLKNLHLEGIEPDKEEARILMKQKKSRYKKVYTEVVYHKKAKIPLFITKALGCTSIYEPNIKNLKYYTPCGNFIVQKKILVEAKPLDLIIPKNISFDFINMDVQGAEYDVIKGGKRVFKNIVGISFESHFFEYYKKEKLFPDIHNLLKKNFSPLRLNLRLMGGEISEIGDAVYIKKHIFIKNKEDLIKRILFCVLFERKEHIEFLLRNYGDKLSESEKNKIKQILKINLKKSYEVEYIPPEENSPHLASKKFLDGRGYLK